MKVLLEFFFRSLFRICSFILLKKKLIYSPLQFIAVKLCVCLARAHINFFKHLNVVQIHFVNVFQQPSFRIFAEYIQSSSTINLWPMPSINHGVLITDIPSDLAFSRQRILISRRLRAIVLFQTSLGNTFFQTTPGDLRLLTRCYSKV